MPEKIKKDRKGKAPALRYDLQVTIGKYKAAHPDFSYRKLAEKYHCTPSQARTAANLYATGKLGGRLKNKREVQEAIERAIEKQTASEMLNDLVNGTLAEIQADKEIKPTARATLIHKLAQSAKILLDRDLTLQIKNPDAERVAIMCRFLNPSLTDEQIIELWKKADETYRASKQR